MSLELYRNFLHRRNQQIPDQIGEPEVVSKELPTKMGNLKKKETFTDFRFSTALKNIRIWETESEKCEQITESSSCIIEISANNQQLLFDHTSNH